MHKTAPGADVVNNVIAFDAVAGGDMLPWAIGRLRNRLREMLTEAGGQDVAARLDDRLVARAVDEVEALAQQARAAAR